MKIFDLRLFDSHYYIKKSSIVEKITFDNRTFYAKFKHIQEPLTPLIIKQHLNRQYTIAVPLIKDNRTNYLLIEYKGAEHQRFYHLIKHLFKSLDISTYTICQGKDMERLQVFIEVDNITLDNASKELESISNALSKKMIKKWKCLPSNALPPSYNIVTLPYQRL